MQTKKRTFNEINENVTMINKRPRQPSPKRDLPKRDEPNREEPTKHKNIFPPLKKSTFDEDLTDEFFFRMIFPLLPPKKIEEPKPEPKIEDSCRNPECNHKTFEEDATLIVVPNLTIIKTIDDLITLGKSYHCKKNTEFAGMNLRIMCNLIVPLTEMKRMIGMNNVKENLVNQILFFLQGNHTVAKCNKCLDCSFGLKCLNSQTEMLHTVITGPPGVGKTELGKILGKVYKEMGILSKDTFKLVTRSDLLAGYLGQTSAKTQKVIDECKGGVMFIDEAYALGHKELRDSFSKECIDTLNQNLSERRDFLCIIAGYEDDLESCFFKFNDGLRRRFTFRYDIKPYNASQLLEIFEGKVKLIQWSMCYETSENDTEEIKNQKTTFRKDVEDIFKKNIKKFPNYGGDIETLLLNCKIVNTRRCTFNQNEKRKSLSVIDVKEGIELFSNHRKYDRASKKDKSSDSEYESDGHLNVYSF